MGTNMFGILEKNIRGIEGAVYHAIFAVLLAIPWIVLMFTMA